MRGSSYHQAPNKPRSKSKTSDSSASTSSSSSTGSRPRRKSSSGNRLAPSFHRANGRKPTLEEPKPPVHVTIAPIAPTMLKVGKEPEDSVNGWTEGLGDDGDDDIPQSEPERAHSDRELASDHDDDDHDDNRGDYGQDTQDGMGLEVERTVMEVGVFRHKAPKNKDGAVRLNRAIVIPRPR